MKTDIQLRFLVASALFASMTATVSARSWRINNDATKKAHFTSINAAMSSADVADGDTLYLDPGCIVSEQTISKSVTVIGTGWGSKAHSIAYLTGTTVISKANTKFEGVYCTGIVSLRASYITLERCKFDGYLTSSNYTAQFVTIRQCRISNYITGLGATSNNTIGWTIENNVIVSDSNLGTVRELYNCTIRNNYICNTSTYTGSGQPSALRNINGGNITNNILMNVKNSRAQTMWGVSNSNVQDNVLSADSMKYASTYPENICLNMGYADAETALFVKTGEDVLWYQITADSPARGAGTSARTVVPSLATIRLSFPE